MGRGPAGGDGAPRATPIASRADLEPPEVEPAPIDIRTTIHATLVELFEEDDLPVPEIQDDTLLLETELDSLGFAVLVTRLEEQLGFDPFSMMDDAVYPATFREFVDVYERYAPTAG